MSYLLKKEGLTMDDFLYMMQKHANALTPNEIKKLTRLEEAAIEHKGLFLNADAGFDSKSLREFLESKEIIADIKPNPRNGEQPDVYFDEELYKNRFKIEQANGWLDGYKGLIMRYEYLNVTWIGMLLLGFISKFLKKV